MWTVVVRDSKGSELYRLPLNGRLVIGRTHNCQIILKSNAISRQHARIEMFKDQPVFVDLGSSNGSLLNGAPVTKPAVLDEKSRVELGDFLIKLEQEADESDRTVMSRPVSRAAAPPVTPPPSVSVSPGMTAKPEKDVKTLTPAMPAPAPKQAETADEDDISLVPLVPMGPAIPEKPRPAAGLPTGMRFLDLPSAPPPTAAAAAAKARTAADSAVDLLDKQLEGIRHYRDDSVKGEKERASQVDAEWLQVLKAMRQLQEKVGKHPKVQHFTISRDEQEISVKVEDSSKRGYIYYVLSRRHPTGKYDDLGAVWLCELGGEELTFQQPMEAMAALVRRLAPRLA